jgi:hypothetical protein
MEQITGTLQTVWRGATVTVTLEAISIRELVGGLERALCDLRKHDQQSTSSQRWASLRDSVNLDCPAMELWALWACQTAHDPEHPGLAEFGVWLTNEQDFGLTDSAAYQQIVQSRLQAVRDA